MMGFGSRFGTAIVVAGCILLNLYNAVYASGFQSVDMTFEFEFDNNGSPNGPQRPNSVGVTRATIQAFPEGVPVEIWDEDFGLDDFVASEKTNSAGKITAGPYFFVEDPDLYFEVQFENDFSFIADFGPLGTEEYQTSTFANVNQSTLTAQITLGDNASDEPPNGLIHIVAIIDEAAKWINSNGGDVSALGQQRVQVTDGDPDAQFAASLIEISSYNLYLPLLESIQLARPFLFRPEVIVHEYGHAVMAEVTGHDFPGGEHTMTSADNAGLAFSEGTANFIAAAVFDNPDFAIDYDGQDLEENDYWKGGGSVANNAAVRPDPPDGTDNSGEIVEGAVASILWDLYDDNNDDEDFAIDDASAVHFDNFSNIWLPLTSLRRSRRTLQNFGRTSRNF